MTAAGSAFTKSAFTKSALGEPRNDFRGHGDGLQPSGIVRMASDQNPGLEGLDRQRLALEHLVGDLEARALETLDPALDGDPVAMGRGDVEFRPRIDHR